MEKADFNKKCEVLITYGWCRVGYGVLRSLSKNNLNILVGSDSGIGMCRFSKLNSGFFCYPSPYRKEDEYVKVIKDKFEKSGARVIIAPHEESFPLIKNRHLFPKEALAHYPSWDIISKVNDKKKAIETVSLLGISTPKMVRYESVSELASEVKNIGLSFPLVIKLRKSNGAKGVFYANSEIELEEKLEKLIKKYNMPKEYYPVVQEYVTGEGWGVSGVWNNGEPLAMVTHKRLHEKTFTGGTSTLRITQSNPILEEYALRIMSHLKWQGAAMIEFKFNENTKQGWFIEINPRLWGSLQLGIQAGVDIPWILYNLAIGNPIRSDRQKDGVICKWIIGEGIVALKYLFKLDFYSAFGCFKAERDTVFDDFFWDDPMILLGEGGYYLKKFLQSGFNANPEEKGMVGY